MRENEFQLSNIQRAYLMGRSDVFEVGGFSTHVYYELYSQIPVKEFNKAFNEVIKCQDMLRTIFNKNGTQTILQEVPTYEIETFDWRNLSKEEIKEKQLEIRSRLSHEIFDIHTWPLFNMCAARISDEEVMYFLSVDMLIADGSSVVLMLTQTSKLYYGQDVLKEVSGKHYYDYVDYQEKQRKSNKYKVSKEYWLNKIETLPESPQIPKKKQEISETARFNRLIHKITPDKWAKLKQWIEEEGFTPTIATMSVFCALMGYWSNQDEFTLNTPIMSYGRRKLKMQQVIGDFTEPILMTTQRWNGEQFCEYMKKIRDSFMESYKYSAFDGIDIMNTMRNQTKENVYMPIVFTSMLFQDSEIFSLDIFGKILWGMSQTPQVHLDCQLIEMDGEVSITWDYVEEIFEKDNIQQMFDQYVMLLEQLPEIDKVGAEILSIPEKQREQLKTYNHTFTQNEAKCVLDIILPSFEKYKDRIAVSDMYHSLTYKELDEKSDSIAQKLKDNGVQKNDIVAILCERSVETIVGIVGILKCGAAYVPVDISYPEKRKAYICENSKCKVVLNTQGEVKQQTNNSSLEINQDDDLAYIIYTSGSTGTPKGVMIGHNGVTNTVVAINKLFNVRKEEKWIGLSSFGFDLSVYDVFGTLSTGAELVIVDNPVKLNEILDTVDKKAITSWNSVPAFLDMLLNYVTPDYCNYTMEKILLSGDWIPVNMIDKIHKHFPNAVVYSLGGATEASIWSIYYEIKGDVSGRLSIPYGYPLPNQQMYILDENMQQVPFEVEGEIYIGGQGVALGYANDLEKTEKSFIQHKEYGRLYKTGDYGKMKLNKGYMEFCGRKDNQVKLRGYRIELDEIKNALCSIPCVDNALVEKSGGHNSSEQLIAYITMQGKNLNKQLNGDAVLNEKLLDKASKFAKDISFEEMAQVNKKLNTMCTSYMQKTLVDLGIWNKADEWVRIADIIEKGIVSPKYEKLLQEWMKELTQDGYLEEKDESYYLVNANRPNEIEDLWKDDKVLEKNQAISCLKEYASLSCNHHIALLKGEVSPLELFFPKGDTQIADSMYRTNPVSKYVNGIAQEAILHFAMHHKGNQPFRILEIGAGIAGTTSEIFGKLNELNVEYDFTDVSDYFLNNAKNMFSGYSFLKYKLVDINEDFQTQGIGFGTYDLVIAANVLHDAQNLNNTLNNIGQILKEDGHIVIVEATQNLRVQMTTVGFIEGFSNYEDERKATNHPLLSPNEWQETLEKNKFKEINIYPNKQELAEAVWQNVIVVHNNGYFGSNSEAEVREALKEKLPTYMIPQRIVRLTEFLLNNNGKVDRKKLPSIKECVNKISYVAPRNEKEKTICDIWSKCIGKEKIGVKDDFFELGGDSLQAIQIVASLEKAGYSVQLVDIYKNTTIETLAMVIQESEIQEEVIAVEETNDYDESLSENDLMGILQSISE